MRKYNAVEAPGHREYMARNMFVCLYPNRLSEAISEALGTIPVPDIRSFNNEVLSHPRQCGKTLTTHLFNEMSLINNQSIRKRRI